MTDGRVSRVSDVRASNANQGWGLTNTHNNDTSETQPGRRYGNYGDGELEEEPEEGACPGVEAVRHAPEHGGDADGRNATEPEEADYKGVEAVGGVGEEKCEGGPCVKETLGQRRAKETEGRV